jgi:hypothetical protein
MNGLRAKKKLKKMAMHVNACSQNTKTSR